MHVLPWLLPGILIWAAVALLAAAPLARYLQARRAHAFLLLMSVGLILAATLTPTGNVLRSGLGSGGGCDVSRLFIAPAAEWATNYDVIGNVLLFMPLGILLGLLPGTGRTAAIVLGAFLLTVFVEVTQSLVPDLGRGCETADMVDNTIGLLIGLGLGLASRLIGERMVSGSGSS